MRRFILGWRVLGYARRFNAHIVNYADDFVVLGRAPSATMRAAVESLMKRLKLTVNVEKTRCCRVPEEPVEFLGYRIGRNYRRDTGRAYIGTRPSQASVQSICRRISELTARQYGLLDPEVVVGRINRSMTGWANYFCLGQVSPAYAAIDRHATRRLRQWLCRKHKVRFGKVVRFPDAAHSGESDHRFRAERDQRIRSKWSPVGAKRRGCWIMSRGDQFGSMVGVFFASILLSG